MDALSGLTYFSAGCFIVYGGLCLTTNHMNHEFKRYGLSRYRTLVGVLEILGGSGLILGHLIPGLSLVSSGGLSAMMILALHARWRVRDKAKLLLPALALLLVNLWLFFTHFIQFTNNL